MFNVAIQRQLQRHLESCIGRGAKTFERFFSKVVEMERRHIEIFRQPT
jgi:hypothetical protein